MLSTELHEYISAALLPEIRFSFERLAAMQHQAAWSDVAAKAKRLVQSGQVTILRNAPHHVMAHVIGDNGEYNVEISRHDPSSQIIEQWNCECPWAQFAFDRTRKWKKLEGRVCSHVLGAYWKAKSTPLDMADQEPGYAAPSGQKVGPAGPGQESLPGMPAHPMVPVESDEPPPNVPPAEPMPPASNQQISVPEQPSSPFTVPKQPQSPGQTPVVPQRQQLQLFDITAPPGMQPIPGASPVSVPGGRPPTPGNPVQFPGTFSHFIPMMTIHTSRFIYGGDTLTEFFEMQRAAGLPIYVALTNLVALEQSGGKIPVPGSVPYDISSEGIPLYRVIDLGWNPQTGVRENSDVNALQGAPEHSAYSDAGPGRRGEVIDFDPDLKMAYIMIPLNYPEGGDVRLHPHSLKGWVDYGDLRPLPQGGNPARRRR